MIVWMGVMSDLMGGNDRVKGTEAMLLSDVHLRLGWTGSEGGHGRLHPISRKWTSSKQWLLITHLQL